MKSVIFAKRNYKEISRDIASVVFMLGLPLFLLIIFQQFQIPSDIYKIDNFAPSIVIFSYGFISLFTAQLISKDRTSSFLTRLFSSPMKPRHFILGYTICMIPIAVFQSIIFFLFSIFFGLTITINLLYTILLLIIVSLLYVGIGIFIGCIAGEKSSAGVASIVIQLICFTSGMWFDTTMVGKVLGFACKILPFKYSLDIARYSLSGNFSEIIVPLLVVIAFTIAIYALSIVLFKRKMNNDIL